MGIFGSLFKGGGGSPTCSTCGSALGGGDTKPAYKMYLREL